MRLGDVVLSLAPEATLRVGDAAFETAPTLVETAPMLVGEIGVPLCPLAIDPASGRFPFGLRRARIAAVAF
jgi:hypothetical protein